MVSSLIIAMVPVLQALHCLIMCDPAALLPHSSQVTGRARLGGVPVGVIAVETQTVGPFWWLQPDFSAASPLFMRLLLSAICGVARACF